WSAPGLRIGSCPQSFVGHAERTLGDVLADAQADLVHAEAALQHAADELARGGPMADYEQAAARFEALGGYERSARVASVLGGLELTAIPLDNPVPALSGGPRTPPRPPHP